MKRMCVLLCLAMSIFSNATYADGQEEMAEYSCKPAGLILRPGLKFKSVQVISKYLPTESQDGTPETELYLRSQTIKVRQLNGKLEQVIVPPSTEVRARQLTRRELQQEGFDPHEIITSFFSSDKKIKVLITSETVEHPSEIKFISKILLGQGPIQPFICNYQNQ